MSGLGELGASLPRPGSERVGTGRNSRPGFRSQFLGCSVFQIRQRDDREVLVHNRRNVQVSREATLSLGQQFR
jgi:hypothetical protein